jgi:hypothetical protein
MVQEHSPQGLFFLSEGAKTACSAKVMPLVTADKHFTRTKGWFPIFTLSLRWPITHLCDACIAVRNWRC